MSIDATLEGAASIDQDVKHRVRSPRLTCPSPAHAIAIAALFLSSPGLAAWRAEDDEPLFAPSIELRDAVSEERIDAPSGSPLWVSIGGGAAFSPEGSSFNAIVLIGIPLDRVGRRRSPGSVAIAGPPGAAAEGEPLKLKPLPRGSGGRPDSAGTPPIEPPRDAPAPASGGPPPGKAGAEGERSDVALPVVITPEVARAAVRAALKRARLEDPTARVDAIASRARAASLLPEMRFRISRLMDEDQSLSPTEYDPGRVTASGGTSLWLEARATWRLDKVVFGDEEVALERMRHERVEAQSKLTEKVLDLLFRWQRAEAAAARPDASPEDRLAARLSALEAKASLDILTGGALLTEAH